MPSTVISSFSYDQATEILHVKFVSGLEYDYKKVPEKIYLDMKQSRSKGVYFNHHIKGKYQFEKR